MTRPRRSHLFMPGSNPRALEKARNLAADGLILDLEDSVAPDAKAVARDGIAAAIADKGFGKREILIRTNGLDTPWWADDVAMAAKASPDGILVPKVSSVEDLEAIGRSPCRARRRADGESLGHDRDRARRAACRGARRRGRAIPAPRLVRLRVRPERHLARDAHQDAAGPRGDDPDDHPLHPGDARPWPRNPRRPLQRHRQFRRFRHRMRAGPRPRFRRQDADPPVADRSLQRDLHAARRGSRARAKDHRGVRAAGERLARRDPARWRMVERLHADMARRTIEIADAIAAMGKG